MKRHVVNYSDSVRARLLAVAKRENVQFEYLLLRYSLERFLYRLGMSKYSNQFILKGASAFAVWLGPFCRVTRDVDIESLADAGGETLVSIFKEICSIQYPEDAVVFDIDSFAVEEIKKEDKYPGTRICFNAFVGVAKVAMQFDIGVGDSVYPAAETMEYPVLLGHDAPVLKTYPRYTVIAEKFSTMIIRGMLNSRIKDYHDIWLLSETFAFDGNILQEAIVRTFKRRNVDIPKAVPDALSDAFSRQPAKMMQWRSFLRTVGKKEVSASLEAVTSQIRKFLSPVFSENGFKGLAWSATFKNWTKEDG